MKYFYEVRTKRLTVTEKNTYKTVKEIRLFEAENYSHLEELVYSHMENKFPKQNLFISKLVPSRISDFAVFDGSNTLWKGKVFTIGHTESGKEKKIPHTVLTNGSNLENATKNVGFLTKDWPDVTIDKVESSKIVEVVLLPSKKNKK